MNSQYPFLNRLLLIKIIHTLVWLFFNCVIFYLVYAVISNRINEWVWIGMGLIAIEAIILLLFGMMCPLTIMARKYSSSTRDNFDIFLPNWLAKNNKLIYSVIMGMVLLGLAYRLLFH